MGIRSGDVEPRTLSERLTIGAFMLATGSMALMGAGRALAHNERDPNHPTVDIAYNSEPVRSLIAAGENGLKASLVVFISSGLTEVLPQRRRHE